MKEPAMQLIIEGQPQTLIPIRIFREQRALPDDFGVQMFEPKDFSGLAAIDRAGTEMKQLRAALLDAVPARLLTPEMLPFVDGLVMTFRAGLAGINDRIGLRIQEIEFAVAGFSDVLHNWAYALIRANASHTTLPTFQQVYMEWIHSSVRVSQRIFPYAAPDGNWQIQVLNHAYGRIGLRVAEQTVVQYVYDGVYTCPAEGFMITLLAELAERIAAAAKL